AAIAAVETGKTQFVPKMWENTFFEWMRNIQPWCVSRQIWWGHQIPAWYGPDGAIFVEETEAEALAAAAKHYGHEADIKRDPDVLDTWFSSALWPFSTLGWPERTRELQRYYPTDVLVTGFDIIFFWVARMMMMGCKFMGDVPFKTVYIHALVRDERGQKMSKSKGNIIDPLDLIARFGTDALRFTLTALAAQGRDIKLAESRIEGYRNFATKLWNATRYAEMNGCQRVPGFDPASAKLAINQWIITSLADSQGWLEMALEEYRFNDAANAIYQFVWGNFCDWYIEFTKPILTGSDEGAKAETQATVAWMLERIFHLLHPIMPFITEELWRQFFSEKGTRSLMTSEWPEAAPYFGQGFAEINFITQLISEIRSVRSEMNIPGATELLAFVNPVPFAMEAINKNFEQIKRLARLKDMKFAKSFETEYAAKNVIQVVVTGAELWLDVAGAVDLAKERARLQKEVATVRGELDKISKKLGNEQFLAKAKPEAIEEQRERQSEYEATLAKLDAALARIGA
ncbi:MAG TPA: class I tRNA ligase family protein, partial [Stellaceae bacterium]|nr:class I tRNA ligase family protein [Stellaceae bacterium]